MEDIYGKTQTNIVLYEPSTKTKKGKKKKRKKVRIPEATKEFSLRRGVGTSTRKMQSWARKHGRPKRILEP